MIVIDYVGYNLVSYLLLKILPLVLLALLVFNMIQRKFIHEWGKKRMASFYFALFVFAQIGIAFLLYRYRLSDWLLIPGFLVLMFIGYVKRRYLLPFTLRCEQCKARLSLVTVFLKPENLCKACKQPDEK